MITTAYRHITADLEGVPIITGTTMKVVELILDSKAYGWSPEELHFQHPDLSMAQIYSALAYYWDYKDDLDQDIERRLKLVEHIKEDLPPTRLDERLRAKGMV